MKVYFPLPLETKQVSEKWHEVIGGFDAIVEEDGYEPVVVHVPHGFKTNFASVPRIPFAYLLTGGVGNRPAVIHDFLYSAATHPRAWCDDVFLEGLHAFKKEIAAWKARIMYLAVRVAGWRFYGKTKGR